MPSLQRGLRVPGGAHFRTFALTEGVYQTPCKLMACSLPCCPIFAKSSQVQPNNSFNSDAAPLLSFGESPRVAARVNSSVSLQLHQLSVLVSVALRDALKPSPVLRWVGWVRAFKRVVR